MIAGHQGHARRVRLGGRAARAEPQNHARQQRRDEIVKRELKHLGLEELNGSRVTASRGGGKQA